MLIHSVTCLNLLVKYHAAKMVMLLEQQGLAIQITVTNSTNSGRRRAAFIACLTEKLKTEKKHNEHHVLLKLAAH